ncbi:MAG TPA: DAK2 domain-containing protein, partial [Dehalococcoidia bacterium]
MQHPRTAASGHPSTDGPSADAHSIDGPTLARALIAAADALGAQADAINAINVFPVPDGDTGTNMWMTMRAAADEVAIASDPRAAVVAKAAAQGALMGAKGNSGVILSQILAGFAAFPAVEATLDAEAIAGALERARDAAYHVVSQPREGTILTAISAAATAARAYDGARADEALAAAVEAAHDAVARTPELLPVLKEAGVVDSGAQGLYVMLDGMLRGVRGESTRTSHDDLGAIDTSWLAATQQAHAHGETSGYCTEFVVSGDALSAETVRERLRALGDSLLVVGGGDLLRVHLHTHAPDEALAYARSIGAVSREKIDDMSAQFANLAARDDPRRAATSAPIAAVAVV